MQDFGIVLCQLFEPGFIQFDAEVPHQMGRGDQRKHHQADKTQPRQGRVQVGIKALMLPKLADPQPRAAEHVTEYAGKGIEGFTAFSVIQHLDDKPGKAGLAAMAR